MNSPSEFPVANGSIADDSAQALQQLDATLHMLAKLPVPVGMEDRVFAGVLAAPRGARVLHWPRPFYTRDWMRGIAAAAIVLAVGGGGWGIYSHVEQNAPAQVEVTPRRIQQPGAFSSAGVMRRPQTITGPEVNKPAATEASKAPAAAKAVKTPAAEGAKATAAKKKTLKKHPAKDAKHTHGVVSVKPAQHSVSAVQQAR